MTQPDMVTDHLTQQNRDIDQNPRHHQVYSYPVRHQLLVHMVN